MKRGIYLIRQDVQHLKSDYVVAAVVIADDPEDATQLVLSAVAAGGYAGQDGIWDSVLDDGERPICLRERLQVDRLGTAEPGPNIVRGVLVVPEDRQRGIVVMTFGQDYDA